MTRAGNPGEYPSDEQCVDEDWRKMRLMMLAVDGVGGEFSSL